MKKCAMISRVIKRRNYGRLLRGTVCAALLTLCASPLLRAAQPGTPFRSAESSLEGLFIHATLPYADYGPGHPVRVYITFLNGGKRTLVIARRAKLIVEVKVDGKWRLFPQREKGASLGSADRNAFVTLAPGSRYVRVVTLRPGRRDLLPGDYPLRALCFFKRGGKTPRGALSGTIVSKPATLSIRFKVIMVY